jgi:hypothetical protein
VTRFTFHSLSGLIWPVLLICYSSLVSCSSGGEKKKEGEIKKPEQKTILKPSSSFPDTLVVNTISVVFFKADSLQLGKFEKVVSPMVFESIKHDCLYQMGNTRTVLKRSWPKVTIAEAFNKRYVLFVKEDGSQICIDLDKLDVCGVMLFNRKKEPQTIVDMTNIETELRYYFEF